MADTGGFVLVVGPSGAGKDSLIDLARDALRADTRFLFPRRVVTRPSSASEDNEMLNEAAFAEAEAAGAFAVSWHAHGLGYGIPRACVDEAVRGKTVICNVSRDVVAWCRANLPNVRVAEVTAPVEVLAERLAHRARPEDGDLMARLRRSLDCDVRGDIRIINDGSLEDAGRGFVAFLRA
jgi:ribose 1,5-bisphosphokinase